MHNNLTKSADSLRFSGRKRKKNSPKQLFWPELLAAAQSSAGAQSTLRALLAIDTSPTWRGTHCVPPGSVLDAILNSFKAGTSVSLDLPFVTTFAMIAGYLASRCVTIIDGDESIDPRLWIVGLAESGGGKTYAASAVRKGLAVNCEIPGAAGIVSAAALFESISLNPKGLMLKDEFGRFVKRIEQDEQAEIKDTLLDLYNGTRIERTSKKDGVQAIEHPVVSILGFSVLDTWSSCVSAESMLDGFAQRFLYIVARNDPARPGKLSARWKVDKEGWAEKWSELTSIIHPSYTISSEAGEAFDADFAKQYDLLPESFYRRVQRAAHTYALAYHLLLGDKSSALTVTDYGWASRVISLHLRDAADILKQNGLSDLQRVIAKCQAVIDKKGGVASARDLVAGVREIRSAGEAKMILQLLSDSK
jgi:hypothetical protein